MIGMQCSHGCKAVADLNTPSSAAPSKAMKRITLLCLAFQLFSLSAHSQLQLNTGDAWTYEFNSLPHTGFISTFVTNPVGGVSFTIDSSTFQTGDKLRYEMFENN